MNPHCPPRCALRRLLAVLAFVMIAAFSVAPRSAASQEVARVWHGVVRTSQAADYHAYLLAAVQQFASIEGNRGFEIFQETRGEQTDFLVISHWTSLAAIHAFAGADLGAVHPLPRDPEFLIDPEARVHNYSLVDSVHAP